MISTRATHSLPCIQSDPPRLFYVSDRRIRTKRASAQAAWIFERIQTGVGADAELDEKGYFSALQTCAYRATCRPAYEYSPKAERSKWTERWEAIRDYLVEKNLGLAHSMVGRFRFGPLNLHEDDLLSDALYALMRSVERFNPWKGFRFSTYACGAILRMLIRRRDLESRHQQRFHVQYDIKLDWVTRIPDFQTELYVERLNRLLDRNRGELTDVELHIIAQRFPVNGNGPLTLQKIGEGLGLTRERVRQIQNIALRKLRDALNEDPLVA